MASKKSSLGSSRMPSKSWVGMSKTDQLRADEESKSLLVVLEGPGKHHSIGEGSGVGDPRFTSGLPEI
jgi:hypothetical protein